MITNVKGEFRKFSASIAGENFQSVPIEVSIETASIFTNEDNRDGHLKGADFFDVENHKELTFKSTSVNKIDAENFKRKNQLLTKFM